MIPSVAVSEAMDRGADAPPPPDSPADVMVAAISVLLVMLSLGAAGTAVAFDVVSWRRLTRLLALGASLRSPRLILAFSAAVLAAAELIRLPFARGLLAARRPLLPCLFYPFFAHAVAEPALLAVILLLLRASTSRAPAPPAAIAALVSSLPFMAIHGLFLLAPASVALVPGELVLAADGDRCAYPPFAAALLAVLVAMYVPLFMSAIWGVVAVAINKRLRLRLYMLASAVAVPLPVQAAALALSAVWAPRGHVSPWVHLVAFAAVATSATAALAILVVRPVLDALVIAEHVPEASDAGPAGLGI